MKLKPILAAAAITLIFLSLGIFLLEQELIVYGVTLFVLLPFLIGYILGNATTKKNSLIGFSVAFFAFEMFLVYSNLEGFICVLMAMPLVLFAYFIGWIIKRHRKTRANNKALQDMYKINAIVSPMILFILLGIGEKQLLNNQESIETVTTSIELPYSNIQVYNAIKHVDTLDARLPFLMRLDLPIPQKCILEEEKVGALRTCYFEGGTITERVTELEPGKVLKMDVIDYQLTGRKWLGFKEAIYTFEEMPNGDCKLTRITTYSSELHPRIYWRPFEKWGIQQEHELVFRILQSDLSVLTN